MFKKFAAVAIAGLFTVGLAHAQASAATAASAAKMAPTAAAAQPASSSCDAKAIGKNGKPLAGAAKASFIKKCEADAKKSAGDMKSAGASDCEAKAVGSNGKPLVGAAKVAFVKKCQAAAGK
ncbi:hypothetical protein [Trinickia fusca]|uniref:Phosphate starvation-inducible protein PsiF n=1 Tax=Trinickia fusca TaxID=2419777 RepID=A0A494XFL5_9BURK|nr:hypothetical protein [Trinickia fusca]RKP48471.1 hypothetical protein D7S89_12900 [Trinickia fusca]